MKVLVLAAGRSKRMQPIADKNFLNFLGKPLLQHQLEMILRHGLKEIIIIGGRHNLEAIRNLVTELKGKIEVVEQKNLDLGMCGAVLAAKKLIDGDEILIVSSNDVVDDEAFKLLLAAAKKKDSDSCILGKKVEKYFPGGYLQVDKNGRITEIVEKPGAGNEPSDLVNLVFHWHRNSGGLIEKLEKARSKKDDLYEVALSSMIKEGLKMKAVSYKGFWQAVKHPWHIQKVFDYLMKKAPKKIAKNVFVAKTAVVDKNVILDEGVKILDGAVVNGRCYIGKNSIVATNALVRDSNIGANCMIGFGSEVARSFLGDDVWLHTNYVGDSVLENNISFGGGAVVANLRLDEANVKVVYGEEKIDCASNKFGAVIGSNVRIGVNTSIMPGIRIGSNTMIGSGLVISENIDQNSFVRGEWKLKISKNKFNVANLKR